MEFTITMVGPVLNKTQQIKRTAFFILSLLMLTFTTEARAQISWEEQLKAKDPFYKYGEDIYRFSILDPWHEQQGSELDAFTQDPLAPDKFDELVETEQLSNSAGRLKISPNKKFQVHRNSQGLTIENSKGKTITTIHRQSFMESSDFIEIGDFCWSKDSTKLYFCTPTGLNRFDVNQGVLKKLPQPTPARVCALSSDGKLLAHSVTVFENEPKVRQLLRIFDAASGKINASFQVIAPTHLQWSPKGKTLAISNGCKQLLMLDGLNNFGISFIDLPGFSTNAFAWSPDGKQIAVVKPYRSVLIYSSLGEPIDEYPLEGVSDVAWPKNHGKLLCRVGISTDTLELGVSPHNTIDNAPSKPQQEQVGTIYRTKRENLLPGYIDNPHDPWENQFDLIESTKHFRLSYRKESSRIRQLNKILEETCSELQAEKPVDWVIPLTVYVAPDDFALRQFIVHNRMMPREQNSIILQSRNAMLISENTPVERIKHLLSTYIGDLASLTCKFDSDSTPDGSRRIDQNKMTDKILQRPDWNETLALARRTDKQPLKQIFLLHPSILSPRTYKLSPDGGKTAYAMINTLSFYNKSTKVAHTIQVTELPSSSEFDNTFDYDWSPDSKRFVTSSEKGCQIFDLEKKTRTTYKGFSHAYYCSWSKEGLIAASGYCPQYDINKKELHFFNAESGTIKFRAQNIIGPLSWSPNGALLAAATPNSIEIFDPKNNWLRTTCDATGCDTSSITWSPNGEYLAVVRPYSGISVFSKTGVLHQKLLTSGTKGLTWNKSGDGLIYHAPDKNKPKYLLDSQETKPNKNSELRFESEWTQFSIVPFHKGTDSEPLRLQTGEFEGSIEECKGKSTPIPQSIHSGFGNPEKFDWLAPAMTTN